MDLEKLTQKIVEFRDERDWGQFHTPKELATALSIEAGELQELFLWKSDEEIETALDDTTLKNEVGREVADVVIYALLLGEAVNLELSSAVQEKLEENADKYPVDRARGSSQKYTDYC